MSKLPPRFPTPRGTRRGAPPDGFSSDPNRRIVCSLSLAVVVLCVLGVRSELQACRLFDMMFRSRPSVSAAAARVF